MGVYYSVSDSYSLAVNLISGFSCISHQRVLNPNARFVWIGNCIAQYCRRPANIFLLLRYYIHKYINRISEYNCVGVAVQTPRLSVLDLSAYIRAPTGSSAATRTRTRAMAVRTRLSRPPRPQHPRFTSDEYDTQDSDSPF